MFNIPRRLLAALALAVSVLFGAGALVACGGQDRVVYVEEDDDFLPASYGVNGQCYYRLDPQEAYALMAAGLCPSGWRPVLMPDDWLATYWLFYGSPRYYDTYVPVSRRATYTTVVVNNWGSTHSTQIRTRSSVGQWRTTSGKTRSGAPTAVRPSARRSAPIGNGRTTPGARRPSSNKPNIGNGRTAPAKPAAPRPPAPRPKPAKK